MSKMIFGVALLLPWLVAGAEEESVVPYGSDSFIPELSGRKTGYFHIEKLSGRPTVVDPLGRGYMVLGADQVGADGWFCKALGYSPYGRHVKTAYRDREEWTKDTIGRLKTWGFNTLGNSGSAVSYLGRRGLSHAIWLDMGGRLCHGSPEWRILPDGKGRGSLFPNVFHPDFVKECDALAKRRCAPCRNDPWLLGYYIDNELCWWGFDTSPNWEAYGSVMFDVVKAEEPTHSARKALEAFLNGREPTPELKLAFMRLVAERYFSVTTAAIRRHDPNHMIMGCRFAGNHAHPVVWEMAGKYCDVVTFNFYPQVDLNRDKVMDWSGHTAYEALSILYARTKKPLLVTEWSFPALDTGRPCRFGAGQRFYTQQERTRASELFAKTLLSHEGCIGYNYFMWVDQPALGISGPKSEDSNYGLVNEQGVPYAELTDMFMRLHAESSKWRTSLPPVERAYTPPKPVSEWDQFLKATAGDRGQVGFARTGACWRLTNSVGLVLGGRLGGLMVDEISLGGKSIGTYGAMIRINVSGPDRWLRATNLVDVAFEPRQKGRVGTLRLTAEGESEGIRFRVVHRLFVTGGRPEFAAQVVSVENCGEIPIDLRSVFMLPVACETDAEVLDVVQHLWRGPRTCGWRLKDGSSYVISSHDPSVGVCCRGECDFTLPRHGLLRTGESCRADVPMSAVLTLTGPVKAKPKGML